MLKKHLSYCVAICWHFFIPALLTQTVDFTSSNLPIVVVDTRGQEIPNDTKIAAGMGIIDNGRGKRNRLTDAHNAYSGEIGIEIRGSSSAAYRKKSYNVETRDDLGNNLNVPLMGFPPENDWILYGPYVDKSLMRNVLLYRWSNLMGRYASRTRYCELVLNGEYKGVYVLCEKIKRDKNRVDIPALDWDDVGGDSLTGGYILKIDKPGNDFFYSHYLPYEGAPDIQWIQYQYHYPRDRDIRPEQKLYIETFIHQFEAAMDGPGYANAANGYPKFIETDSFVDHFLLNEMCKNVDGYRLSAFLYKQRDGRGGKLHAGPIWDMDLAFGNANYYGADAPDGWELDNLSLETDIRYRDRWLPPFWWQKLVREPNFAGRIRVRWQSLRSGLLSAKRVDDYIDSIADTLNEVQDRNFQIWSGPGQGGEGWWPVPGIFYTFTSYGDEVAYLKGWIESRFEWMDAHVSSLAALSDRDARTGPADPVLLPNFPNPFNSVTEFEYRASTPSRVRLTLTDVYGRIVRILSDRFEQPGWKRIAWDGRDDSGRTVASGIYVCHMASDRTSRSIRLTLLK